MARKSAFIGGAGYVKPSQSLPLDITILAEDAMLSSSFKLGTSWNRIGLAVESRNARSVELTLRWKGAADLDVWGLAGDRVFLPKLLGSSSVTVEDLNQSHLAPETYYFAHDAALSLDIDETRSTRLATIPGERIALKKCSYCGRLLPVNPRRLGTLAFHKHNAKKTRHQNECRACKKWRINDTFNPMRTVDQLHESSLITRERKMFLREPEILQRFKDRTGAGLKTMVWERFGRRCFYCDKPLDLEEVELDHTRPLAYLWPIDEHATCLCAEHNNQKREKFPVDFYSEEQLRKLARVSRLPLARLRERKLNEQELRRIIGSLGIFATEWDPRHFAATARKVAELRPEIDLFALLKRVSTELHEQLMKRLKERPPPVLEITE